MASLFSLESQIILEALRSGGPRPDQWRRLLATTPNWPRLVELAGRHGVIPLLRDQIRPLIASLVPPPAASRLEKLYLANIRSSTLVAHELGNAVDLLEQAGIPAIPFKGPVFAARAYGDLSHRQAGDIDILVRESDFWWACSILTGAGLVAQGDFSPLQRKRFLRSDMALYFRLRETRPIHIDLHWRVCPEPMPVRLDSEQWFERPRIADFEGRSIKQPPREDLLLYLALHGSLHCWSRFVYLTDIQKHIESSDDWDWNGLVERASKAGLRTILLTALSLCSQLLGLSIPHELTRLVDSDRKALRLTRRVSQRAAADDGLQPDSLRTLVIRMTMFDGFWGRARYALIRAFAPSAADWQFWNIPDPLYFLYYPLRPVRFALSAVGSLFRRRRSP
jgi:hypothetical protein